MLKSLTNVTGESTKNGLSTLQKKVHVWKIIERMARTTKQRKWKDTSKKSCRRERKDKWDLVF